MNCLFLICCKHSHKSYSTIDVCFRHDSRNYDKSRDSVRTIQEQFLWRFITIAAKSSKCAHEKRNVKSTVWLWIVQNQQIFDFYEQDTRRLRDAYIYLQLNSQHCQFVDRSRAELRFKHETKTARRKSREVQCQSNQMFWQNRNNCWQSSWDHSFLFTKFNKHRQNFRILNSLSSLQSAK